MKTILNNDVMEVAKAISKEHKIKMGENISPIKIQKSLYFLFALWIKNTSKINNSELKGEVSLELADSILFEAIFEAWAYGPVVRSVYASNKEYLNIDSAKTLEELMEKHSYFEKGLASQILDSIFNTDDFSLVRLSHEDKCWKDARLKGADTEIKLEAILNEYKNK